MIMGLPEFYIIIIFFCHTTQRNIIAQNVSFAVNRLDLKSYFLHNTSRVVKLTGIWPQLEKIKTLVNDKTINANELRYRLVS